MLDIKKASSEELLQELTNRNYLKKINIGKYSHYDLIPKYDSKQINAETVYIPQKHHDQLQ
jgi:hypothetical protein